jgi:uncharacterized protein (DUF2141 family)
MTKTIKTLSLSAVLAVVFLSAGAFAGSNKNNITSSVIDITSKNVTVIYKNSTWPLPGQIAMEACKISRCQDV